MEHRNAKIKEMRARGHTLEEVGKVFGLTRERIRQIVPNSGRVPRKKKRVSRVLVESALRKAVRTREAWGSNGWLSRAWLANELEVSQYIAYKSAPDLISLSKVELIFRYGLGLWLGKQHLAWFIRQHGACGESYEAMAAKLSITYVPVSAIALHRHAKGLGFVSRKRGRHARGTNTG